MHRALVVTNEPMLLVKEQELPVSITTNAYSLSDMILQ